VISVYVIVYTLSLTVYFAISKKNGADNISSFHNWMEFYVAKWVLTLLPPSIISIVLYGFAFLSGANLIAVGMSPAYATDTFKPVLMFIRPISFAFYILSSLIIILESGRLLKSTLGKKLISLYVIGVILIVLILPISFFVIDELHPLSELPEKSSEEILKPLSTKMNIFCALWFLTLVIWIFAYLHLKRTKYRTIRRCIE
jgi:hypothetical protein